MHPLLVQMRGITKAFPGVVANDGASLELRAGEVHALLGENGAGKTTLMNILGGLYRPDAGEIRIRSRAAEIRSPGQAIALGIGMVHQRFKLVPGFTVAENITLGMREPRFVIRPRSLEESIGAFARDRGLPVHPGARVWQLSVGEQQRVEIVKALWRGAEILIMDEPTAVLTPREVRDLFGVMRRMADEGKAIVFITHKLIEVMEIADRVTVMRQGRHRATVDKAETSPGELASLMMGGEHEFPVCAAGTGRARIRGPGCPGPGGRRRPGRKGAARAFPPGPGRGDRGHRRRCWQRPARTGRGHCRPEKDFRRAPSGSTASRWPTANLPTPSPPG